MITDRTQQDVDNALNIRKEKVQKFVALDNNDIEILEKGFVTINTLNRVEEKQNELKELLNQMGYWNTPIINKLWDKSKIFDENDLKRLFNNTEVLKKAFFEKEGTPETPLPSYYWQNWNDLEQILVEIEDMITIVKNNYVECGNIECGGTG